MQYKTLGLTALMELPHDERLEDLYLRSQISLGTKHQDKFLENLFFKCFMPESFEHFIYTNSGSNLISSPYNVFNLKHEIQMEVEVGLNYEWLVRANNKNEIFEALENFITKSFSRKAKTQSIIIRSVERDKRVVYIVSGHLTQNEIKAAINKIKTELRIPALMQKRFFTIVNYNPTKKAFLEE